MYSKRPTPRRATNPVPPPAPVPNTGGAELVFTQSSDGTKTFKMSNVVNGSASDIAKIAINGFFADMATPIQSTQLALTNQSPAAATQDNGDMIALHGIAEKLEKENIHLKEANAQLVDQVERCKQQTKLLESELEGKTSEFSVTTQRYEMSEASYGEQIFTLQEKNTYLENSNKDYAEENKELRTQIVPKTSATDAEQTLKETQAKTFADYEAAMIREMALERQLADAQQLAEATKDSYESNADKQKKIIEEKEARIRTLENLLKECNDSQQKLNARETALTHKEKQIAEGEMRLAEGKKQLAETMDANEKELKKREAELAQKVLVYKANKQTFLSETIGRLEKMCADNE